MIRENIWVVTLFLSVFVTSCTNKSETTESLQFFQKTSEPIEPDGEMIFRGIFFLQGDIASNIDALKPMKEIFDLGISGDIDRDSYDQFCDKIVEQIKLIEPLFFEEFENRIKSNDPFQVKEIIVYAGKLLIHAAYKDEEIIPYLEQAKEIVEDLDMQKCFGENGEFDPIALQEEFDRYRSNFQNSANTKANFGIVEGRTNYMSMCAVEVVVVGVVALAGVVVTVVAGGAYANVFNVGLAINAFRAINLSSTINVRYDGMSTAMNGSLSGDLSSNFSQSGSLTSTYSGQNFSSSSSGTYGGTFSGSSFSGSLNGGGSSGSSKSRHVPIWTVRMGDDNPSTTNEIFIADITEVFGRD